MARIWTPQAQVPAAAITYAGSNSNNQPLLFTTQFGVKGTYASGTNATGEPPPTTELKWVIKSVEVTLVRDWNTSQAMVTIACHLPNLSDPIPPLPDLYQFRKGNHPFLTCEDEIRIYLGYVDSPTTPITGDMLDDTPFDFADLDGKSYPHDPNKPLVPVFWGFIDKLDFSGNSKGLQVVLSCRDRTRIFADTRIISIPAFQGNDKSGSATADGMEGFAKGDRESILLQLASGAAGNTTAGEQGCSCWKPIHAGPHNVRGWDRDGDNLKIVTPKEDPAAWTRQACLSLMNDKAEPRFHIWAERPPIVKGEASATLQVLNKTPLEIIDYLAKCEERPIDFYASHVNGDFVFGPRSLDMSGFEDELRAYRTYFFRSWPKQLNAAPPSPNQMVLSIRTASSTMATFNKFVIIDSTNAGGKASLLQSVQQGMYALPWQLDGRDVSPPCRTQIIYDGALSTYDNPDQGALIVGLAQSRIWSRDINGVQMELVGDPTWFPGEGMRVYNTVLHDRKSYVIGDPAQYESTIAQLKGQAESVAKQTKDISQDEKAQACPNNPASVLASEIMTKNPARIPTDIDGLVLPLYKARTVQHKLTAQGSKRGYTTIVIGVSDY